MEQQMKQCPLCDGELTRKTREHVETIGTHVVKDSTQQIPFCASCDQGFVSSSAKQRYERRAAIVALSDLPSVEGGVVKDARKILGLKQSEMADLLEMDVSTISRYETGVQPVPRYVQLAIAGMCRAVEDAKGDTSVLQPKSPSSSRVLRVAS